MIRECDNKLWIFRFTDKYQFSSGSVILKLLYFITTSNLAFCSLIIESSRVGDITRTNTMSKSLPSPIYTFKCENYIPNCLKFHFSDQTLYVGTQSGEILVWNLEVIHLNTIKTNK